MKQRKFVLSTTAILALEQRENSSRKALELKRLQAVRLYGSGAEMTVVQQVSGARRRSIQRWVSRYEVAGVDGLTPGWRGSNHRGLSREERLAVGLQLRSTTPSEALGRAGADTFWTVENVAELVDMHYHLQ